MINIALYITVTCQQEDVMFLREFLYLIYSQNY